MTEKQIKAIEAKLESIDIDIYSNDIQDLETIDELDEFLNDNGFLNVEIVYYYNAMKYLMENDTSLCSSLKIANELGFELKDLNSETLASLLASQNMREEFGGIRSELEEIIDPAIGGILDERK